MMKSNAFLANVVLGISVVGLLAACGGGDSADSSASGTKLLLSTTSAPGQNFNLSSYTLQTLDSSKNFTQINPIGSHTSKYFYTDSSTGAMTFYVPSGAGTSGGSHYPRVELRNNKNWKLGGTHTETVTLKVLQKPSKGDIIIGQIHGPSSGGEAVKLRWTSGGDIIAGVKTHLSSSTSEAKTTVKTGLGIGSTITFTLKTVGNKLTVTVNGTSKTFTYDSSWNNEQLYFKLGAYPQDDASDGSYSKVAVSSLITE